MLIEKTKNEKIEYMEVYLCDDYNRGWILIPIEKIRQSNPRGQDHFKRKSDQNPRRSITRIQRVGQL